VLAPDPAARPRDDRNLPVQRRHVRFSLSFPAPS
jgi:hypothetical protein